MVAGKQRYRCKACGCNYREGDARTNEEIAARKALCILLYAMARGSFRMLGKILGIHHTLVYRWVRSFGERRPERKVSGGIAEMEFDEMWRFLASRERSSGSSQRWIVAHGEPWPGCPVVVMRVPSDRCATR
jgi:rubredoxin